MRNSQEKNRDKDSRAIGNEIRNSTTTTETEFVDNSREGIEARRLQEVADNSLENLEMQAYQQNIDNGSEVLEMEEYQDKIQDTNVESSYEIVNNGVDQYYIELLDSELQNMEGILKNVGTLNDSTEINRYMKDYAGQLLSANKRHEWCLQSEDLGKGNLAETLNDRTTIPLSLMNSDDLIITLIHELTHSLGTLDVAYEDELLFQFLGENEDWKDNADSLAYVINIITNRVV